MHYAIAEAGGEEIYYRASYVRRPFGSVRVNTDGYCDIKVDERRWMKQHRYVMEQYLGRALLPGEEVHHRNGDRTDNRIENLELWSTARPSDGRAVDKLAWAQELIRDYTDLHVHHIMPSARRTRIGAIAMSAYQHPR